MSPSCLLLVVLASNPGDLGAEVQLGPKAHSVELGVSAGAFLSPGMAGMVQSPTVGEPERAGLNFLVRLGYAPFTFVGAEVEAGHVAMDVSTESETGLYALRGHVIGQLPARFSPFVLVGGGVLGLTTDDEAMGGRRAGAFHYGAGLKFFAVQDVVARVDVRHTMTSASTGGFDHHFEVLGGVAFTLLSAD